MGLRRFTLLFFIVVGLIPKTTTCQISLNNPPQAGKIKPVFQLDANRSYLLDQWIKVNGLRLGINYHDLCKFGLAFYSSDYVRLDDLVVKKDTFLSKIQFQSASIFADYILFSNYKWEANVSPMLGSAGAIIEYKRTDNLLDSTYEAKRLPVFVLSGAIEHKIWPFIGVGAGLGYRFLFKNKNNLANEQFSKAFSSPFYSLKIKLHLEEVYKFVFKKEQYLKEREKYRNRRLNE